MATHLKQPAALLCGAALCVSALVAAPATAKGSVFLNGVNIDGVVNQKFENVTVTIDDKGNILILAKGYEIQAQAPVVKALPAAASDAGPVTKRYFLVSETSGLGLAQYDIDVFINSTWIKRISSNDPQAVVEISRWMRKGKNTVHFAATKVMGAERKSSSPAHYLKIYIGEGNMGGNNVMIDNALIEYQRDASEMGNFADELPIEGR
ncbi:MAG: hypothetical protein A2138_20290 [Deltaproteobacteria bacterium RBG_16_71_12]|nr:MAG: hypothetical protein A2138_20290 [Deltaproteobacteria bacterium RBG_16_71_12]